MRGLTVMALVLLLSGCSFSAPGVHARIGDPVHIDVGHDAQGGNGCPPGLRKQGRC